MPKNEWVDFQYGMVEIDATDVEVCGFLLDMSNNPYASNGFAANGAVGGPIEDVRICDNTVLDTFAGITMSLASGEVTRNRTDGRGHVANVIVGGEEATPAEVEVSYNRFTGQDVAGVCYFGATELPGHFPALAQPAGALTVYVHDNDVSRNYGLGIQTSPRGAFPYPYTYASLRAVVENNRIVENAGPAFVVESGECFFQACPDEGAPADTHLSVSGNQLSGNGLTAYFSTARPGSDIPLHDSSIVVDGDIASLGDFVVNHVGPRNTVSIGGVLY